MHNPNFRIRITSRNRRLEDCTDPADPTALIIGYVLGVLYMFLIMALLADELFVPALQVIANKLKLSQDVAGATLMAAGGSSPEFFTALVGTFQKSDVGFGAVVSCLNQHQHSSSAYFLIMIFSYFFLSLIILFAIRLALQSLMYYLLLVFVS